jgi:colanic acid biosynthesis glycosyl transferase WcaI
LNVLLVTSSYPPEIRSSSHLMQELAEELHDRGHRVTVATCYPQHNLAEQAMQPVQTDALEGGIRIIRIRTLPAHRGHFIVRGLSQISLPYLFWFELKKRLKDGVDAAVVYSPPLPLWKVGHLAKRSWGAKFILNTQDLFPQNAVDLGILQNPLLIRFFEHMEKEAYLHADTVTVHSPSNRDFLLQRGNISASKLATLHNWVDVEAYHDANGGAYREALGLGASFILFFGGVLGPSQGLDLILDAAKGVRHESDIVFLLAGDGIEKERLMMRARQENLQNVIFHPFVSKEEYGKLLSEVDVGLVCLSAKNKTPVVPGKILGYMSAGVPVLAFLNRESDGHPIIREAGCGYSDVSDDPQKAVRLILELHGKRNHLKEMGRRGYQYVVEHFSKKQCVDELEGFLGG